MQADKIRQFIALAGQECAGKFEFGDNNRRALGAQLLLSEVLEYVMKGLGVDLEIGGVKLSSPQDIRCSVSSVKPNAVEMVDGLADVAYTMYWNAVAFGIPLEEAFELVCDNNLDKFVELPNWMQGEIELKKEEWDCGLGVKWPKEVEKVSVIKAVGRYFAVGKDSSGKVRKPSTYKSVDLSQLVPVELSL